MALPRQSSSKPHNSASMVREAQVHLAAGRADKARSLAQMAVKRQPDLAAAWHILALACEALSDNSAALDAYQQAMSLAPDQPQIGVDLARLAMTLDLFAVAERLLLTCQQQAPGSIEIINSLALAQASQMNLAAATATLTTAIEAHPAEPILWNTLGLILFSDGRMDEAATFLGEALRLNPSMGQARIALADALMFIAGFNQEKQSIALAEGARSIIDAPPSLVATARVSQAKRLFAAGRLTEGWQAYEARHDLSYEDATVFPLPYPQWKAGTSIEGRHLLLIGEQGLGDEVLFAQTVPDVLGVLGPKGRLTLALDPRLQSLAARSFPSAQIVPHTTGRANGRGLRGIETSFAKDEAPDLWAPLGTAMAALRPDATSFGAGAPFLMPDLARVAHWKAWLATLGTGRKVGIIWKSLLVDLSRARYFAPLSAWEPVLTRPGIQFISLQYGQADDDLRTIAQQMGVKVTVPAGLDLKDDLEGVTALCAAIDLTIGPATATTNLAAASGSPVKIYVTPASWPLFGTDHYPSYPKAKVQLLERFGAWDEAMAEIAEGLG
jgi:tetratricopeptide (TPR) repeat protein